MSLAPPPEAVAMKPPLAPSRWYTHRYNRSGYYRLALVVAPRLPRRARCWLAALLARGLAPRFPAERAAVRRNLARVHPGREEAWLEHEVGRIFENFGVCFADLLSFNRGPASRMWRYVAGAHGQEPTRRALSLGRGCVCITAHLGNWELAGRLLALLGRRVHVVMAPERDPRVATLLQGPEDDSVRFVRRESPLVSVGLVSALRRGEVVAFQMDRATGERADCRVPFFGAPAPFSLGPFLLAAAAGAPVVPAFCMLGERREYRLSVEAPLDVTRGKEIEGLARAVAVLERYVRVHSDQWFNFFDVWGDGPEWTCDSQVGSRRRVAGHPQDGYPLPVE